MEFTGFELPELTHAASTESAPVLVQWFNNLLKKNTLSVKTEGGTSGLFRFALTRPDREEEVGESFVSTINSYQLKGRIGIELQRRRYDGSDENYYTVRYSFGKQYIRFQEVPYVARKLFPPLANVVERPGLRFFAISWGNLTVDRTVQVLATVLEDQTMWDETPPTSVQEMLRKHQKFLPQLLEHLGKIEDILRRQPAVHKYT